MDKINDQVRTAVRQALAEARQRGMEYEQVPDFVADAVIETLAVSVWKKAQQCSEKQTIDHIKGIVDKISNDVTHIRNELCP